MSSTKFTLILVLLFLTQNFLCQDSEEHFSGLSEDPYDSETDEPYTEEGQDEDYKKDLENYDEKYYEDELPDEESDNAEKFYDKEDPSPTTSSNETDSNTDAYSDYFKDDDYSNTPEYKEDNDDDDDYMRQQDLETYNANYGEESYVPIFLAEIYNAGAHTPVKGNHFNQDYIHQHGSGNLLPEGYRQHFNLGYQVRENYKDLISSIEVESELEIYSSGFERNILSALAHNNGLFPIPNGSGSLMETFILHKKEIMWKNLKIKKKMLSEFEHSKVSIPINVQDFKDDYLFHSKMKHSCKAGWKKLKKERHNILRDYVGKIGYYQGLFTQFGLFPNHANYKIGKLKKLKKIIKHKIYKTEPKVDNFEEFSHWFEHVNAHFYSKGENLLYDDDVFEKLRTAHSANSFAYLQDEKFSKVNADSIIRQIWSHMSVRKDLVNTSGKDQKNNGYKYLGFSANSWNIASLLLSLNQTATNCHLEKMSTNKTESLCTPFPDFAEHFLFELSVKDDNQFFVRVKYNDYMLSVCPSGKEYCPFEEFEKVLEDHIFLKFEHDVCDYDYDLEENVGSNFLLIVLVGLLGIVILCLTADIRKKKAHLD